MEKSPGLRPVPRDTDRATDLCVRSQCDRTSQCRKVFPRSIEFLELDLRLYTGRELQSYSTTVFRTSPSLPSGDNYSWSDQWWEIVPQNHIMATCSYCYDSCTSPPISNQLTTASGVNVLNAANASAPGTIIGYMARRERLERQCSER